MTYFASTVSRKEKSIGESRYPNIEAVMMPVRTGMLVVDGARKALPRREDIPRMRPLVRRWWVVERCRRRAPTAVGRGVKGILRLVTVEKQE